jgi:beta-glucosidase
MRTVDAGAQENGRRLDWTGKGAMRIEGPPIDLSRQATGDMAISIRYRVETAPTGKVALAIACGDGCGGSVDITPLLSPADNWRALTIKLTCLRDAGADMTRVTSPFTLAAEGRLALEFTDIRIIPNPGDALCPK